VIEIREQPGHFAAEIVDPEEDLLAANPQARASLRRALAEYGVVCVRVNRALDKREFRAVAEGIGPIKDPVGRGKDGSMMRYDRDRQVVDSGFVMTEEVRGKLGELSFGGLDDQRPGLFETFHCDDTYTEEPASATVLVARQLPRGGGGNTSFLDMRAAYDLLAPDVKRRLIDLRSVNAYDNEGAFPPRVSARGPNDKLVEVSHPVVRTHPITGGLSLFIDLDRAKHVDGMPVRQGRELLRDLQQHSEAHAPRYNHAWCDHDILVWDNASVQHKANGDFAVGESRRFWRHMIAGARPI
jgi:alpha-ketoglutarate-dependent taurine dioxygenase